MKETALHKCGRQRSISVAELISVAAFEEEMRVQAFPHPGNLRQGDLITVALIHDKPAMREPGDASILLGSQGRDRAGICGSGSTGNSPATMPARANRRGE